MSAGEWRPRAERAAEFDREEAAAVRHLDELRDQQADGEVA